MVKRFFISKILILRVLLATIRNLGACPCPRCLVPKEKIPELGTVFDDRRRVKTERVSDARWEFNIIVARDIIYKKGKGVKSAAVERILAPESSVPTMVKFSIFSRLLDCILINFLEHIYILVKIWIEFLPNVGC